MKYRSVQLGLISISAICVGVLLMAMFFYYKVQSNQNNAANEIAEQQQKEMVDKILEIKQEQANAAVYENSAWNELIEFINGEAEEDWAEYNIGEMSESYNGADVAVFDVNGKLVYQNPTEGYSKYLFYDELKITSLFRNSWKTHFFQVNRGKLFEYFGSSVVSSSDIQTRKEAPSGFLIFIREVNDELLADYQSAMGDVTVGMARSSTELEEIQNKYKDMIFHEVNLCNQYGNPIAYMYIYSENRLKSLFNNFIPMLIIMFSLVLVMFGIMLIYTRKYVVKPLTQTADVLESKNGKIMDTLCANKTEFGLIGRQLKVFMDQKDEIEKLYKEADERHKQLTEYTGALENQKREIESQMENIQVLNLQIMERNKETEKKNVQISVKNSQLEEQSQNIQKLLTSIDELEYKIKFNNKALVNANANLLDNQNYATRLRNVLQVALTPTKHIFSDFFLYSNPKEKIGGDFWFAKKIDNWVIAGVGDCNMQGISGAVLSGVDLYLLDEILNMRKLSELSPELVLDDLNEKIQNTMGEEYVTDIERDGLHLSMFMYNTQTLKGFFAGAKRTMLVNRRGEVNEFFGDNLSIGKIHDGKKFNLISLQMFPDDVVYMYSDGCTEVVGGPYCKKLLNVNFKKEIAKKQVFTLTEQKTQFKKFFEDWIGELEQTDDITMLTFKI